MNEEKKFFGEMTKEEFKEALKIIFAKTEKKSDEKEDNEPQTSIFDDIKYYLTFEFVKDFIKWCKTPLTQEVFIQRGKKFKAFWDETVETVVFVLVAVIIIRFFIGEIRWIPSGSMKPTLNEGDRIIVERYSRFFETPKRGDIMVFYPPSTKLSNAPLPLFARLTGIFCNDVAYIKRVIGLPGDKIEVVPEADGSTYVWINDEKYVEDYIKSPYDYPSCPSAYSNQLYLFNNQTMKCGPFYLGENEYFMMGDNRGNSQDSRYWGTLKGDRFVGRAVAVFWPIGRNKVLKRLDTDK